MSRNMHPIASARVLQVVLTSNKDGLYDMKTSFEDDHGYLPEDYDCFFSEAHFQSEGEFENGELVSYCWGPHIWDSSTDEVQKAIEDFVKDWDGCFELVIVGENGVIERLGYLHDYPEFDALANLENGMMQIAA